MNTLSGFKSSATISLIVLIVMAFASSMAVAQVKGQVDVGSDLSNMFNQVSNQL